MTGRILGIQALRALAACLVLLSHIHYIEARDHGDAITPLFLLYGYSGVDLFFVISGFVMVLVTRGRLGHAHQAGAFLFSRMARIYPTYWLFCALAACAFAVTGSLAMKLEAGNIPASLMLWPQHAQMFLGIAWTLAHEMYFYFVFTLLILAPARFLPWLLALWAALVLAGQALGAGGASTPVAHVFDPLTLEFIAGAFVGLLATSGRRLWPHLSLALGLTGLVAGMALIGPDQATGAITDNWPRTLVFTLPCALIVYGAVGLELDHGWRAPGWAVRLGDWSYSLYLGHFLVISALSRLWVPVSNPGSLIDNAAAAAVMVAASITIAWAAFRWFETPVIGAAATARARLFHLPQTGGPRIASRVW